MSIVLSFAFLLLKVDGDVDDSALLMPWWRMPPLPGRPSLSEMDAWAAARRQHCTDKQVVYAGPRDTKAAAEGFGTFAAGFNNQVQREDDDDEEGRRGEDKKEEAENWSLHDKTFCCHLGPFLVFHGFVHLLMPSSSFPSSSSSSSFFFFFFSSSCLGLLAGDIASGSNT